MAKYILNVQKLQEGDIILINDNERLARIMNCDFDHATYYLGGVSCIEADGVAVKATLIDRYIFCDIKKCKVLRLKDKELTEYIPTITSWIRSKTGMEYSTREARLVQSTQDGEHPHNRMFCTRLITQGYESCNIKLVDNPAYSTPQQILFSEMLIEVESPLMEIPEDTNLEEPQCIDFERDANFSFFNIASKIFNADIQTFDNIIFHLIRNPEKDKELAAHFQSSDIVKIENKAIKEEPSLLNRNAFYTKFQPEDRISELYSRIHLSIKQLIHFRRQQIAYHQLSEQYNLSYFKLFDSIYQSLICNNSKIRELATQILYDDYGIIVEY